MAKETRSNILIIEDSDLIKTGLVNILFEKNSASFYIKESSSTLDWQFTLTKIEPRILVVNPSFFHKNKKFFSTLKKSSDLKIVGLIYAYYNPEDLVDFDASIHLNDTSDNIRSTVLKLIDDSSTLSSPVSGDSLSERETEVLKWLASGYSTKKIADTLHISIHTVNNHRKNITRKLDVKTISALTIYAVLNNIIKLEDT